MISLVELRCGSDTLNTVFIDGARWWSNMIFLAGDASKAACISATLLVVLKSRQKMSSAPASSSSHFS